MGFYKKEKTSNWNKWSQKYFPGLKKYQHKANNELYAKLAAKLDDDGVVVVPCLDFKTFNKYGEEVVS